MSKADYWKKRKRSKRIYTAVAVALFIAFIIASVLARPEAPTGEMGHIGTVETVDLGGDGSASESGSSDSLADTVPEYSGTPTYVINGNRPEFTDDEYAKAKEAYVELSSLDRFGRCGVCEASLGKEMLDAAGERRDISDIHPTGWNQKDYPDIIEGDNPYLYHRSHLIAHMFAGAYPEIDGEKNLITATEYCNEKGMLPYAERAVQNWIIRKAEGGRVLYRVTPVFKGSELVCRGVHIEAADVETRGDRFHINVYCYNVEPGISIDYATGLSAAVQ